jgi:hypothetical protein
LLHAEALALEDDGEGLVEGDALEGEGDVAFDVGAGDDGDLGDVGEEAQEVVDVGVADVEGDAALGEAGA